MAIVKGKRRRIGFCSGAQTNPTWTTGERSMHRRKERRNTQHRKKKRERERGRESGDKRAAGNKRLANPSCQFNLASNPGEMLIRASLPFLPLPSPPPPSPTPDVSLSARFASLSRFAGLLRVAHARTRARAGHDTLFSRKDTAVAPQPPRRPRGNCVQSELHPPFFCLLFAVSLPRAAPPRAIPFGLPPS